MNRSNLAIDFIMTRDIADRRLSRSELPYLTEEGLVLIDRRAKDDRRADHRPGSARIAASADILTLNTHFLAAAATGNT